MPEQLAAAARELIGKIDEYEQGLRLTQAQVDATDAVAAEAKKLATKTRRLTQGFAVVTAVAAVVLFVLWGNTRDAVERAKVASEENQRNAQIACQNSNNRAEGNLTLWLTILAATSPDSETPAQQKTAREFRDWVKELYAPRDCDHLSETYEIPPPPDLSQRRSG